MTLTDRREPPLEPPPTGVPDPDGPAVFVDRPERDPASGRHLIYVAIALVTMLLFWWGA